MKAALSIFALLAMVAATSIAVAQARNCTTTCTPTYGGGQTCNTHCW